MNDQRSNLGSIGLATYPEPLSFGGEMQRQREQLEAINEKNSDAIRAYVELLQYLDNHPEVDELLNRLHMLTRFPW